MVEFDCYKLRFDRGLEGYIYHDDFDGIDNADGENDGKGLSVELL